MAKKPKKKIPEVPNRDFTVGLDLAETAEGNIDGPGRPSNLTRPKAQRFLQSLAIGNTFRSACALAGIGWDTFTAWRRHAVADKRAGQDSIFTRFYARCREVEEEAVEHHVKNLHIHSIFDYKASLAFLERRRPRDWGKRETVALAAAPYGSKAPEGHILHITVDGVAPEKREPIAQEEKEHDP